MIKLQGFEEQAETVEFYKIKLMQRDSEFQTLKATLKKIQLKQSRDLKQAKSEVERTKQLLKHQKNKLDKNIKLTAQLKEQNIILHQRLIQLKEQKEKDIQGLRTKYNAIKEQIRSYQRILPTHTFIQELNTSMAQLQPYQDIFINLKIKTDKLQQLTNNFEDYKKINQEKINQYMKNLQQSNNKKDQFQKNLKEFAIKQVDTQIYIMEQLKIQKQLKNTINNKNQENQTLLSKLIDKETEFEQIKSKVSQFFHQHQVQLRIKEEQIQKLIANQNQRYQQQMDENNEKNKQKIQFLTQQLCSFEEQIRILQEKLISERENYEESYNEFKNDIERIKSKDQDYIEILQKQNQELEIQIVKLKKENQKLKQNEEIILKEVNQWKLKGKKYEEKEKQLTDSFYYNTQILKKEIQHQQEKIKSIQKENNYLQNLKLDHQQKLNHLEIQCDELKLKLENQLFEQELDILPDLSQQQIQSNIDLEFIRSKRVSIASNFSISLTTINYGIQTQQHYIQSNFQNISSEYQALKQKYRFIELKLNQSERKNQNFKNSEGQKGQLKKMKLDLQNKDYKIKDLQIANKKLKMQFERLSQQSQSLSKKLLITKQNLEKAILQKHKALQDFKQNLQTQNAQNKLIKQFKSSNEQLLKQIQFLKNQLNVKRSQMNKQKQQFEIYKKKIDQKENEVLAQLKRFKAQNFKSNILNQLLKKEVQEKQQIIKLKNSEIKELQNQKLRLQCEIMNTKMSDDLKQTQIFALREALQRQRKQRALKTVSSEQKLSEIQAQQLFTENYKLAGQKEGELYVFQRQISDLKEQIQELKRKQLLRFQQIQIQQNQYIQQIITMKVKTAQFQMKALQKENLYFKLKKKIQGILGHII